ncbi:hypothetical protein [Sphingomonas caeni]|uniref:hypothetical protein n=1 Tax=Sphingomonas caeni TaxID=2984949 RepID=UPI00222F5DEF|nr:hypothetical protein [Sphingomonas caeni]
MGTVWDRTAEFLTDNFAAILPISLLAYFVPLSIQGSLEPVMENASAGLALTLSLIGLAFAGLVTWGWLAITAMALDHPGDPGSVGLRRLVPALLVSVVTFGGICLLALPPILTVGVSGRGIDDLSMSLPLPVLWALSIYCLLAIVAAVWLTARLILAYPVVVAEKAMFGAIPRSWRLTRGVALPIVGVTLLYAIVSTVATLATKLVFGSVFTLVAGPGGALSLSSVLTSVMVAAVQTAFFALVPVFAAKLYQALIGAQHSAARA